MLIFPPQKSSDRFHANNPVLSLPFLGRKQSMGLKSFGRPKELGEAPSQSLRPFLGGATSQGTYLLPDGRGVSRL